MSSVAIVDIGSNSIKLLVARRSSDGRIETVLTRTLDARISAGISKERPELAEDGLARGVDAITTLLEAAKAHGPARTQLVATSAVRDASNGEVFASRVKSSTGLDLRILTGHEEAAYIGRGLLCDPSLHDLRDFYVFDLGGGSLEMLAFRDRALEQTASMQLGCVRLMERFISDPAKPLGRTPRYRTMQHVHDELVRGPFRFNLPHETTAVGTGGTMSTVRAILGARAGKTFDETDAFIPLTQLRMLLTRLARMPLEERKTVPGLPPGRADIFPTALATLIVLADVAAVTGFRHSVYNLRYGVADEFLG